MPEPEELLAGAVTKLRHAIHPLVFEQLVWDGQARLGDPLYKRMRDTSTAATNNCGAPVQSSKAPTRMDILAWICAIDAVVAEYPGPPGQTPDRLRHYHDRTWNPTELRFIKAVTRNCETWAEQARHLLGDTQQATPLGAKCPKCEAFWVYTDDTRQFALKAVMTDLESFTATCAACKTVWYTPAEQALFRRMLDNTG
jgi:hypothetical protein